MRHKQARLTSEINAEPYVNPYAYAKQLNRRGVASKETGFVDTASAAYPFSTTGSITHLSVIPQGASVNQRVGKKVLLKSLQCRGQVTNGATATTNDIAYLVVYDKRPTGSLPLITDILNTADSTSMNNDANSGRFQILKRGDFYLAGNATSITDTTGMSADFYLDIKSKPWVAKAAGTGSIGDIEEGALYFVTVGNQSAGTGAATWNNSGSAVFVLLRQTVYTAGKWYETRGSMTAYTGGRMDIVSGGAVPVSPLSSVRSVRRVERAVGTDLTLQPGGALPRLFTSDDWGVKELTIPAEQTAPSADMDITFLYTLPVTPLADDRVFLLGRISSFSSGNYWLVRLEYTGSQWNVTLYSVASHTRTQQKTASNVAAPAARR